MANIKSQKKRNLQNERRHERNKAERSKLKTEAKKAIAAIDSGEDHAEEVRTALRGIDKAASKGILHKKTAARRKSRLAKASARAAAQ